MVVTGMPETNTRVLGAVGSACPPCEHRTLAPRCRMGAIQVTVRAPSLMFTVLPMSVMEAIPLLM